MKPPEIKTNNSFSLSKNYLSVSNHLKVDIYPESSISKKNKYLRLD
jgi:hypothetical protein